MIPDYPGTLRQRLSNSKIKNRAYIPYTRIKVHGPVLKLCGFHAVRKEKLFSFIYLLNYNPECSFGKNYYTIREKMSMFL
jgi:hypothetical protein